MLIVLSRAHLLFITEFYRVPPSLTRFSRQQVEENGSLTHYRVFFRAAFCASKYETTRYNGSQFYLVFIEFLEIERFVDNNIHVFRRVRCTRLHYRVFIREVQMEKRSTGPLPSFSLPGFYRVGSRLIKEDEILLVSISSQKKKITGTGFYRVFLLGVKFAEFSDDFLGLTQFY